MLLAFWAEGFALQCYSLPTSNKCGDLSCAFHSPSVNTVVVVTQDNNTFMLSGCEYICYILWTVCVGVWYVLTKKTILFIQL